MANKYGFTEEELALLTEEERLGLEDDDLVDEGEADDSDKPEDDDKATGDDAGTDDTDDKDGDDDADADADGDDDGDDDKDTKDTKKPESDNDDDAGDSGDDPKTDEKPKPQRKPTPLIQAEEITDYDDQVKDIKDQKRELAQKFDDGELSTVEYQEQLDALQEKQFELRLKHDRAELSKQTSQAQELEQWNNDCMDFLEQHSEITASQLKTSSFNEVVKWVTSQEAAQGMTNQEQLAKSYEIWCEQLGIEPQGAKPEPKAVHKAEPKAQNKNLPPNLSKMPAAEAETTDDGKFAYLDSLDGVEYERALAKLSPAEQEQYLSS